MKLKLLIQERQRQGEIFEFGNYEAAVLPPTGTRLRLRLKKAYRSHDKGTFLYGTVEQLVEMELAEDFTRATILIEDVRP